ncbi:hypothetical protein COCMIDRAFT_3138 [Bipolaris oryzae ATCC 44560]|uniref:NACHT domain-containing protein n=1 Tax=Bipolaris oryzae ATCC 44560 TaxID=930090 RepID=W6ZW20_COCMI|nr:uncharacterized protein COCMIDRAFT_3138 [Bipolaris oryzae ATCC 44560]EUC48006.1 hypothetical protein COCMIDRAFT_3138 [Bipolaris oryzae ATCC 44560]
MRLLKIEDNGGLSFAEFDEDTKPPYAILSHRWGREGTEVTFEDLQENTREDKLGYKKIRLCGKQAERDGLQYFWVDTCCINKANKAELSLAIQSMFRWYRESARCYVYLSDVSSPPLGTILASGLQKSEVQNSEWFTRGWTLQELLAPSSVEFFSQEWEKLGDRKSLVQQVHEATGIPYLALQGGALSQFSVSDRLRWIEYRHTTCPEDKAYSLAGVVDVDLAPCYGEGVEGAFRRLHDEIDKSSRCIQDLCGTDSRKDKQRIEEMKGGLLKDAYSWVLHNDSYTHWHADPESRVLWVKGDPGKGKTMLLCGIINELETSTPMRYGTTVSYFFCQANDPRINSATAVLRGLLYSLVSQQPSLVSCVRKKYDHIGRKMFEDANAWITLEDIFADVLQNPGLPPITYLIIDALDECVTDLPKLLDFIIRHSSTSRVKWIVSSRNWPEIEDRLEQAGSKVRLSLELNPASVSRAVEFFTEQRVFELAKQNNYDERTQRAVLDHLALNANDTFLWVALACQHLQVTARRNVLRKLQLFPPGLDALYERMMQHISKKDDAELCKQVLAAVTLVYRPITLDELVTLVAPLEEVTSDAELREIIGLCGSFLTLSEQTLHFVHQSAKDFLLAKASQEIYPTGQEAAHQAIFTRSLQVMSTTLKRDMYGLKAIGTLIEDVQKPNPDPLAAVHYSCIHWIDHLCESKLTASTPDPEHLRDGGVVGRFLKTLFLYWLESLSLCKSMSYGVVSMRKLYMLAQKQGTMAPLTQLVYDAYRFIMYHNQTIEISPLQTYISALLFSPTDSLIRKSYHHEAPEYISITTAMVSTWDACLQTLEEHTGVVNSVVFSHDSSRIVSGSSDHTVKIWDASSGACLLTLRGHGSDVLSVAFSHDSSRVISGLLNATAKVWDTNSGACLLTMRGHRESISSVAFSHDSFWITSGSDDSTVKIWDSDSGYCIRAVKHGSRIDSLAFFHRFNRLVSTCFNDNTKGVRVWDIKEGKPSKNIPIPYSSSKSVFVSRDCTRIASVDVLTSHREVDIWDLDSGKWLKTLEGHDDDVRLATFSHDSTKLASTSFGGTIKIWDVITGQNAPRGYDGKVELVVFSSDSALLASGFSDGTIGIWCADSGECFQILQHNDYRCSDPKNYGFHVTSMVFSHNSALLGSASLNGIIKTWNVSDGKCLHILNNNGPVDTVDFSHNSACLASASSTEKGFTSKVWDLSNSRCIQTFSSDDTWGTETLFNTPAISHDLAQLALASSRFAINVWNINKGERLHTLEGHKEIVLSMAFSKDSALLASKSFDRMVKIWDLKCGICLETYQTDDMDLRLKFETIGPYLHVGTGTIDISAARGPWSISDPSKPRIPQYHGIGLSQRMEWITHNSKLLARIPPEHRPGYMFQNHWTVSGNTIAIANNSGTMWICQVDVDRLLALGS